MNYFQYQPLPQLSPYVRCLWSLEIASHELEGHQRILPDACPELVIFLRPNIRSIIVGQMTSSTILKQNNLKMIGVRFRPYGAFNFFKYPMNQILNQTVPLNEFIPDHEQQRLEDRIFSAASDEDCIYHLQDFLLQQLRQERRNNIIPHFVSKMSNSVTRESRLHHLYKSIGLGQRQIERQFLEVIGLRPKVLERLFRFQNAVTLINTSPQINLTHVAQHCGYYDQPHFSKEFKSFSGIGPKTYMREKHPISDYFASL